MKINLPNQITIGRLLLAVVFFVCLRQFDAQADAPRRWLLDLAAALFIVAGLTDIVDGYLARKYNQITSFGRVIDPFVDKILVLGAYIFLAGEGFVDRYGRSLSPIADWMVVVILGRELLVTSLRGVTEAAGQSFAANAYGKAKMLLQSVTAAWVMFYIAHPGAPESLRAFTPVHVHGMVIVTVLSVLPYLKMARGVHEQMSAPPPNPLAPDGVTRV
jgi:CDP-diacylglycerol--glycerol-3-phosphate 3-phosphatidyltransferase